MKNYLKEYQTIMMLIILFTILISYQQKVLNPLLLIICTLTALTISYAVLYSQNTKIDRPLINITLKMINEIAIWFAVINLIILSHKFINNPNILYTWWFIPVTSLSLIGFKYWFKIYKK